MNKNLWSISYLLVTSGIAEMLYAFLHVTTDRSKPTNVAEGRMGEREAASGRTPVLLTVLTPFKWMGGNAIFFFVAHELYERVLIMIYNGSLDANLFVAHERLFARASTRQPPVWSRFRVSELYSLLLLLSLSLSFSLTSASLRVQNSRA